MKKLAVVTSTRAEYGLLAPVIRALKEYSDMETLVVATGSHLEPRFGMTVSEIEQDGIEVYERIQILDDEDSSQGMTRTMGQGVLKFGEFFAKERPDAVMLLGDRVEIMGICAAAVCNRIPVIHLHGGEITEGAVDEAMRHAITKMSCLHFAATESYRRRIIQMGESPDRVFNVGAVGVENALKVPTMTVPELSASIGHELGDRYAVVTFHPVTLEDNTAEEQTEELIKAMTGRKDIVFLCTKANSDAGGDLINKALEKCSEEHSNIILVDSLGMRRYLSAVKGSLFVLGNSSSGIIEAPSCHVPTVNIGDRQKGRTMAASIINCLPKASAIETAMDMALSPEYRAIAMAVANPYEGHETAGNIAEITREFLVEDRLSPVKQFYDQII